MSTDFTTPDGCSDRLIGRYNKNKEYDRVNVGTGLLVLRDDLRVVVLDEAIEAFGQVFSKGI